MSVGRLLITQAGIGVLSLTDRYGATLSNIACRDRSSPVLRVVAGLNLPLLIRVIKTCRLDRAALEDKALSGAEMTSWG